VVPLIIRHPSTATYSHFRPLSRLLLLLPRPAKAPIQPSLRFNHLRRRPQPKFVWELHFCPAFRRHNGSGKESAMLSSSLP